VAKKGKFEPCATSDEKQKKMLKSGLKKFWKPEHYMRKIIEKNLNLFSISSIQRDLG
jgi:hypothetical protein